MIVPGLIVSSSVRSVTNGWKMPNIKIVIVGNFQASVVYIKRKVAFFEKMGANAEIVQLNENATKQEILDVVHRLNNMDDCDGYIVQLPLPDRSVENEIIANIAQDKDIDGLTSNNIGALSVHDFEMCKYISCTALSSFFLAYSYYCNLDKLRGLRATIIGMTRVVGIPLLHILHYYGVSVSLCHVDTRKNDLHDMLKKSDLIFSCTGVHGIVKADNINENAVLVDVGIAFTKEGKLVGDLSPCACEKALAYSPVPGGVGVGTISSLFLNACISANDMKSHDVYNMIFTDIANNRDKYIAEENSQQ